MDQLKLFAFKERRRIAVLADIKSAGRRGYVVDGEHPNWWGETLIDLHKDLLVYCAEIPGESGFAWHLSPTGEHRLKAVRK